MNATGSTLKTVYPRVCGGTELRSWLQVNAHGLSPRVRGNRLLQQYLPDASGSIPACAGEPVYTGANAWRPAVYPRVCGGTLTVETGLPTERGLSPRVRGNRR